MPVVNVSPSQFQIIQDSKNITIGYIELWNIILNWQIMHIFSDI